MPVTDVPAAWELLEIFEGEPRPEWADGILADGHLIDWATDWPFTSVSFSTQRRETLVVLSLWPSGQRAHISIHEGGRESVRLELEYVEEISIERLHGVEEVVFRMSEGLRLQLCRLRLEPAIWVRWGFVGPFDDPPPA